MPPFARTRPFLSSPKDLRSSRVISVNAFQSFSLGIDVEEYGDIRGLEVKGGRGKNVHA